MRTVLRSATADETRAVGRALAALLEPGDAISLSGELGAGKTTFVQGLAGGLGVTARVASPTFTLVREYRGRLPLRHVDVYRLDRVQDVLDLGLDELLDGGGVVAVEWGDVVEALLPSELLRVRLTVPWDVEDRRIELGAVGTSWAVRWERLEQVTEPWVGAA